MNEDNWRDYADNYKPLVNTGRKPLPLSKCPKDLDFSKTVGSTTYVVKSRFNPQANESLLDIVLRWMDSGTDISE
jgi:hypothetical protein